MDQNIRDRDLRQGLRMLEARFSTLPPQKEYRFHKGGCPMEGLEPGKGADHFLRKGLSSSGSVRWQCKACRKITNVLPAEVNAFSYHQKVAGLSLELYKRVVADQPVTEICAALDISPKTYYHKLKLLAFRLENLWREREKAEGTEPGPGSGLFTQTALLSDGGDDHLLLCTMDVETGHLYRGDAGRTGGKPEGILHTLGLAHYFRILGEKASHRVILFVDDRILSLDLAGRLMERLGQKALVSWGELNLAETFLGRIRERLSQCSPRYLPYYLSIYGYAWNYGEEREREAWPARPSGRSLEELRRQLADG